MGVNPAASGGHRLAIDDLIALAEQTAPLRMPHDHVLGAGLLDHGGRDFAGERSLALPVEVLRRHADVRVPRGLGDGVHAR